MCRRLLGISLIIVGVVIVLGGFFTISHLSGQQNNTTNAVSLAQSGEISLGNPYNIGYQGNNIYFTIDVSNKDANQHSLLVQFSFIVDKVDTRDNSDIPDFQVTFLNKDIDPYIEFQVAANSTTPEKVIWSSGHYDSFSNMRNFQAQILSIDDLPVQNAQNVLNQFAITTSLGQPPLVVGTYGADLQCQIDIRNNDSQPHTIGLELDVNYSYENLGDIQNGSYQAIQFNSYASWTISPGTTRSDFTTDGDPSQKIPIPLDLDASPNQVKSVTVSMVLTLKDAGDENLSPSDTKETLNTNCNYNG